MTATRLITGELKRAIPDAPRLAALELPLLDKAHERRLELAIDDDGSVRD